MLPPSGVHLIRFLPGVCICSVNFLPPSAGSFDDLAGGGSIGFSQCAVCECLRDAPETTRCLNCCLKSPGSFYVYLERAHRAHANAEGHREMKARGHGQTLA